MSSNATTSTAGESPQHFMTAEHMDPGDLPVITEAYNPGVIHPFHSSRKNFTGLGHVQVSLQQKVESRDRKNFIRQLSSSFCSYHSSSLKNEAKKMKGRLLQSCMRTFSNIRTTYKRCDDGKVSISEYHRGQNFFARN